MQYKTITVSHPTVHKKSNIDIITSELNSEYTTIISEQAKTGWQFMGVHPINMIRSLGCKDMLITICTFGIVRKCRSFQIDILVFCREGDSVEQKVSGNTVNKKSTGESMKKAGAAMMNAAHGASNFIKSGEMSEKFNGLKGMVKSKIPGNNSDDSIN